MAFALLLNGEAGLARYLNRIKRFPMLEPQEEYILAKRCREHEDPEAVRKLVTSHLRLVAKIAMGYRGYGLQVDTIISAGNVGLMKAVKRFEPDRGARLSTYAQWWIRAKIQEYILKSWSLVKIGTTAAQKTLFFHLREAKRAIQALDEGDMRPDQVKAIAEKLNVPEKDVIDMNRRLNGDASLNAPLPGHGERSEGIWQDWLVDYNTTSPEEMCIKREEDGYRHDALHEALGLLNKRQRYIFTERRLEDKPLTLEALSVELGISKERVRQIEMQALKIVGDAVKLKVEKHERQSSNIC